MANAHVDHRAEEGYQTGPQISCSYFFKELNFKQAKWTTQKELIDRGFEFVWKGPWTPEETASLLAAAESFHANPKVMDPYSKIETWIAHAVVTSRTPKEVLNLVT
jgi:hypothetical protein